MSKYLVFVVLLCLSCSKKATQTQSTNAESPIESYTYNTQQVMNEKYLSTFNLDINIPINELELQINKQMQGLIYEDNSLTDNNNDEFMCKVWKRDNIELGAVDNALVYKVPLKIWLKVGYKASALGIPISTVKETEFDFNVALKTNLTIDNQYMVQSHTEMLNYEFITTPKIKLGPIDVPVTSLLKKGLDSKWPLITKGLDDQISKKIDIKKQITNAWILAQQPYQLSEKYRTWLVVTPQSLELTPLKISGNSISTHLGIKAYTETTTGSKPNVTVQNKIPPLNLTDKIDNDFAIGIISQVSHEEAIKLAKDTLVGQAFEFQSGKYKVKIDDIDIYGNENQLIIKTDLSGSLDGTIYFRGVPYYDITSRAIKLKNFDYDLKTKNLLAKAANWLLAGRLAKTMQESLEIPCGGMADETKATLQQQLNKNWGYGIRLKGEIKQLEPDQVFLTSNAILARIMILGNVGIVVKGE